MGYEIFERKNVRISTPAVTLNKVGRLILNAAAARLLHKAAVEYVLILWDKDAEKMAFRAMSKKDARAFKITYGKNVNGCSFSGKSFLDFAKIDYTRKHTYPASWNEDENMLEVSTAAESRREGRQRTVPTVDTARKQPKFG